MKWLAAAALILAVVLVWQASRPKNTATPLPRLISSGPALRNSLPPTLKSPLVIMAVPSPEVAEK